MKILAISGSLRAASSNSRLLRAAAAFAPAGMELVFHEQQLADLPHFSPDLDGEGAVPPEPVARFRMHVAAADGVIISCPEYAHGVPGAFKNGLDWIVSSAELAHKPTAVLMASPAGAPFARAALLPTLAVLEVNIVHEASVQLVRSHLDAEGRLQDAGTIAAVKAALAALAAAITARAAGGT